MKYVSLDLVTDGPLACFGVVRCGKIISRAIYKSIAPFVWVAY